MISRRQFIGGLAGLVLGSAIPAYAEKPQQENQQKDQQRKYSYADIRKALEEKNKFFDFINDKFKTYVTKLTQEQRSELYQILTDPEKILEKLPEDQRKKIRDYSLTKKRKEQVGKAKFYWKVNPENPDLSDKIYFYIHDYIIPENEKALKDFKVPYVGPMPSFR